MTTTNKQQKFIAIFSFSVGYKSTGIEIKTKTIHRSEVRSQSFSRVTEHMLDQFEISPSDQYLSSRRLLSNIQSLENDKSN